MEIVRIGKMLDLWSKHNIKIPVGLVGPMGIGKSWAFKDVAKRNNEEYIDLRLSQQAPEDLTGIPYKDKSGRHHWTKPGWWPEDGTKGWLVLEEVNRANKDVQQAVFQLLNERKHGQHILPDGWKIGLAINPHGDDYQVDVLDKAFIRRCLWVQADLKYQDWVTWGKGYGVNKEITGFINAQPSLLMKKDTAEWNVIYNPDAYRMINDIMTAVPNFIDKVDDDHQFAIYKGLLGKTAALAFKSYLVDLKTYVKGVEVVKDWSKVSEKVLSQPNDKLSNTVSEAIDEFNKYDSYEKGDKKKPFTHAMFKNFVSFITALPKEWGITVYNKCYTVRIYARNHGRGPGPKLPDGSKIKDDHKSTKTAPVKESKTMKDWIKKTVDVKVEDKKLAKSTGQ